MGADNSQQYGTMGLLMLVRAMTASNRRCLAQQLKQEKGVGIDGLKSLKLDGDKPPLGADDSVALLALGLDLTNIGVDLNSTDCIYTAFDGPFSDEPALAHDAKERGVPTCFLEVSKKMHPIRFHLLPDDTLFYLFYNFPREYLQMSAAKELYDRCWRYHVEQKCWIKRAPSTVCSHHSPMSAIWHSGDSERGLFYRFEAVPWRVIIEEMTVEYKHLEGPPKTRTVE